MKTKRRYQSNFNYDHTKNKMEINTGVSMVVPNEALSIREILERFTMGYEVNPKQVSYSNTDDFEDIDPTTRPDFDLVDAQEEVGRISDKIREHKAKKDKPVTPAKNEAGISAGSEADGAQPADV